MWLVGFRWKALRQQPECRPITLAKGLATFRFFELSFRLQSRQPEMRAIPLLEMKSTGLTFKGATRPAFVPLIRAWSFDARASPGRYTSTLRMAMQCSARPKRGAFNLQMCTAFYGGRFCPFGWRGVSARALS